MNNCKNNKGMTLVEITVVLLISAIILTTIGSIIIASLNFFRDQKLSDQNKQKLDGIEEYVNNEINFASDITVNDIAPDEQSDWHYIYIKDGILYRDGKKVFDDSYYGHYTVRIRVKGYDKYRLDVKYDLLNKSGESIYNTSKSYTFDNLKIKATDSKEYDRFENIPNLTRLNEGYYRLYYIKSVATVEPDKDLNVSGNMVGDQIECKNTYNDRGVYVESTERIKFFPRDFFYYDGYWWQYMLDREDYNGSGPGEGRVWKRISNEWSDDSAYEEGDIVTHNGVKYICIKTLLRTGTKYEPGVGSTYNQPWKEWFEVYDENKEYPRHSCKEYWINNQKTVMSKLDVVKSYDEIDKWTKYKKYKALGSTLPTNAADFVKVERDGIYHYYYKVLDLDCAPGEAVNGQYAWQELSRDYSPTSVYLTNDIVYHSDIANGVFITTVRDLTSDNNPKDDVNSWTTPSKNPAWKVLGS